MRVEGNDIDTFSEHSVRIEQPAASTISQNLILVGNNVRNIQNTGIYLKRNTASYPYRISMTGNNINGANLVAGGAQNSALLLVAIVGANITSNMIYDDTGNMYRAITESGACNYNLIHANTWGGGSGTTTILGANSVESDNIALS